MKPIKCDQCHNTQKVGQYFNEETGDTDYICQECYLEIENEEIVNDDFE